MYIYKRFVKDHIEQILENKKKDPETIEELDRQLHYMNKAIEVLKQSTARINKRTKIAKDQGTNDNDQLLVERKRVDDRLKDLKKEKGFLD